MSVARMDRWTIKGRMFYLLFAFVAFGCSSSAVQTDDTMNQKAGASGSPVVEVKNQSTENSETWKVDFRNFTYPRDCVSEPSAKPKPFTLQNGRFDGGSEQVSFGFTSVRFADVTNDGVVEAIVVLSIVTGGSALPHCVYVFQRKDEKVSLIHDLYTGDRASNGLRKVYGESGNLVVEQYLDDGAGAARPSVYMQRRFMYKDGTFRITSEEQFSNPDQAALFYPDK